MKISVETQEILNLFNRLMSVPAPSGNEIKIAGIVQEIIHNIGFSSEIDPAGNILVRFSGQNPQAGSCVLAAHIDEIGFIVTHVNPDGTLGIDRRGGLRPAKIGERPVEILGDRQTITGVTSMGAGHGMKADQAIQWQDMRVLTGLSNAQLDQAGIHAGVCGVPLRSQCGPILLGDPSDPLIAAWTFDDRMGVAALLRLLQVMKDEGLQPLCPMIIAFTVGEETGCDGAIALAQRELPETFISIDGTAIPPESGLTLDGRPAVWILDRLGSFDQGLIDFLMETARRVGTELQPARQPASACDASNARFSAGIPRTVNFGHVRENSHGYEVARLSVFGNVLKVLVQFIRTWK